MRKIKKGLVILRSNMLREVRETMLVKTCGICGEKKEIIARICWSKEDPTLVLEWCADCDQISNGSEQRESHNVCVKCGKTVEKTDTEGGYFSIHAKNAEAIIRSHLGYFGLPTNPKTK